MKNKKNIVGIIILLSGLAFVNCPLDDAPFQGYVAVTFLQLDLNTVELNVNDDIRLSAITSPVRATTPLVWGSDNPDVASVNQNGLITAHSPGTANIGVSGGGFSAVCIVTVSE